jgi:hypothetical protein
MNNCLSFFFCPLYCLSFSSVFLLSSYFGNIHDVTIRLDTNAHKKIGDNIDYYIDIDEIP